jgi:heat shock protein HslJ
VSAKAADGKVTAPIGSKPFTLTFDFNKGTFSATTDCNTVGGSFAAESGTVAFGEMSSTLMNCENSQESAFTTLLAESKGFYFTTKGEMVLTQKDGGTVTFR